MEGKSNSPFEDMSLGAMIKTLFIEADWALSRIITNLIKFIFITAIALTSFMLIRKGMIGIFEYGEGLAELSNVEIGFIIAIIVLACRHLLYSSITSVSSWRTYGTPFFWFGVFILLGWSFISFLMFTDIKGIKEKIELYLHTQEHHLQLVLMATFLLSLYISVPSKKLIVQDESETIDTEDELKSDKEKDTNKEDVNETAKNSAA